jgi:hypothetical protein
VVSINPSEKYEFVSCKLEVYIIPNKWKVIKFMLQTTNQLLLVGQKVEDQIRRQRRLKQHSIDVSGLIREAG